MFTDFFFKIRKRKVPVSTGELLDLLKAIRGITEERGPLSLEEFYYISRSCLIKDLKYYDHFDIAFAETFKSLEVTDEVFRNKLMEWLNKAIKKELSEKQKQDAPNMSYEELLNELEKRLQEQKERHDGGNYWIGTGGTSPFGNSGYNPQGLRIGGESKNRSAINSARDRIYKDYRTDETLNIRQIKLALKKLRILKKQGPLELSMDLTIRKTCENCGDLELVYDRNRKNNLKLILLMDIGGSMSPHTRRVNRLFSAGHQLNHFKEFHYYFFHNIIYDYVYADQRLEKPVEVEKLMKHFREDTRVIFVGDALMHPFELFMQTGSLDFTGYDLAKGKKTGIDRLRDIKNHFRYSIWLNPEREVYWSEPTADAIEGIIPMFFLSVQGIEAGVKRLLN
ncbi:MAG: hypothetical protein KDK45_14050 [Leptospiraceae bacterium]|nr:hypothetical protein [Leptospiraceae bacterium]